MKISGEFEVNLQPINSHAKGTDNITLGRMSIAKTFTGELTATSQGEMLSAITPTQGSAGYVAIEQVTGTVSGKQGSFVLQHFGLMNKGESSLVVTVVPDSGTGELTGLTGSMEINIENGTHYYVFDYDLN